MKDFFACLEKLRADAAEAALIRDLATQKLKKEMFERLHLHFSRLADEVEQAIKHTRTS
jgi:hypothetical protein